MTEEQRDPKKSDFLAAEEVKGILAGREQAEQERIVRWVCESLGLSFAPRHDTRSHVAQVQHAPTQNEAAQTRDQRTTDSVLATDIRSFTQLKRPKSDIQFAAVVAYFHRFVAPESQRKEAIATEDLQEAARLAQRPVFKTPSIPLNNAVQQGYLDRAARGAYRLNAVGENLVAMTLPGTGVDTANARQSKRRTPTQAPRRHGGKNKRAG